jgi:hypothetical protein
MNTQLASKLCRPETRGKISNERLTEPSIRGEIMKKANDALARRLTPLIAAAFILLLAGCVPQRGAVISAQEYREFEAEIGRWQGHLEEWFDVFE